MVPRVLLLVGNNYGFCNQKTDHDGLFSLHNNTQTVKHLPRNQVTGASIVAARALANALNRLLSLAAGGHSASSLWPMVFKVKVKNMINQLHAFCHENFDRRCQMSVVARTTLSNQYMFLYTTCDEQVVRQWFTMIQWHAQVPWALAPQSTFCITGTVHHVAYIMANLFGFLETSAGMARYHLHWSNESLFHFSSFHMKNKFSIKSQYYALIPSCQSVVTSGSLHNI